MEHNFSLSYSLALDILIGGHLAIRPVPDISSYGDIIQLQGSALFEYPLIGIAVLQQDLIYVYTWRLDDGTIVGTTSATTWTVPAYTDRQLYRIELEVSAYIGTIQEDSLEYRSTAFVTIGLAELPHLETYQFLFTHKTEPLEYQYSNMDIYRFLSYMPKWSSANKNFFSNTSKIISPLLEQLSHTANRYDTYIENNSADGTHFGYKEFEYEMIVTQVPSFIETEYGICPNLGDSLSFSLESIPVGAITLDAARNPVLEKHTVNHLSSSIIFPRASNLFVKDALASFDSSNRVTIVGMNDAGETISEELAMMSCVPVETLNRFRIVFRVMTERDVEIMTYLDLVNDISFSNGVNLQKRISTVSGSYFDPAFAVDGKDVLVLNGNNIARNDEYKFSLGAEPEKIFVNNLLDVITMRGGSLYSGKMMLDYYSISQENSSVNNNDFIYIQEENVHVGEDIHVTINVSKIVGEYKSKSIRVLISNGNTSMYLSNNGSLSTNKDTWLQTSSLADRLVFSIPVTNSNPYSIGVMLDNRYEQLFALSFINRIVEHKIANNIQDIFVYNKELWCTSSGGAMSTARPVRLGFTSSVNRIHFFNEFETIRFI